jgi:hypothetical protein
MKPSLLPAVVAFALSFSGAAFALDKAACVEAAESAQVLRKAGNVSEARKKLALCAAPACPAVVSADCARWQSEIGDEPAAPPAASHVEALPDPGPAPDVRTATPAPSPAPTNAEEARGATPAPTPPEGGRNTTAWVLAGVTVASFTTFAIVGLSGRADESRLTSQCAPHCPGADVDALRAKYTVADVALAASVLGLGATAWFLLTGRSSASSPTRTGLGPGGWRF